MNDDPINADSPDSGCLSDTGCPINTDALIDFPPLGTPPVPLPDWLDRLVGARPQSRDALVEAISATAQDWAEGRGAPPSLAVASAFAEAGRGLQVCSGIVAGWIEGAAALLRCAADGDHEGAEVCPAWGTRERPAAARDAS